MKKDFTIQLFSVAVILVLGIIFYILLAAEAFNDSSSLDFLEPLILIIIAIILLGIYSLLTRIEYNLRRKR